jgi:hypothetical protein
MEGEEERRKVLFNGSTTQDVLGDLFKGVAYLHRLGLAHVTTTDTV